MNLRLFVEFAFFAFKKVVLAT